MNVQLDLGAVLAEWPLLVKGIFLTTFMIVVSGLLGIVLGCVLAWMNTQSRKFQMAIASVYIEVIRNTPFIVQLFFIFFGLPSLGVKLSPLAASMLAMTINLSAYSAEILRAGIESIPKGQLQAAKSLALQPLQTYTNIVLPQAFKNTWPSLVSQIVIVMLGSSVCAQISTEELSYAANLIQSRNFRAFEAFFVATLAYLGLSLILRTFLDKAIARLIFKSTHG